MPQTLDIGKGFERLTGTPAWRRFWSRVRRPSTRPAARANGRGSRVPLRHWPAPAQPSAGHAARLDRRTLRRGKAPPCAGWALMTCSRGLRMMPCKGEWEERRSAVDSGRSFPGDDRRVPGQRSTAISYLRPAFYPPCTTKRSDEQEQATPCLLIGRPQAGDPIPSAGPGRDFHLSRARLATQGGPMNHLDTNFRLQQEHCGGGQPRISSWQRRRADTSAPFRFGFAGADFILPFLSWRLRAARKRGMLTVRWRRRWTTLALQ